MKNKYGLYVHIPLCISKCKYCDFYKITPKKWNNINNFFNSLELELSNLPPNFSPLSIFIGGGTPSAISNSDLKNLIMLISKYVDLSNLVEWTAEANPSSLSEDKLAIMIEGGINRLSIGIQSFDNNSLKILGRNHNSDIALKAFYNARKAGFNNINIDLIQAIPNQNINNIENELTLIKSLIPDHVSYYNLIYEPNTQLSNDLKMGRINSLDEKTESEIYYHIIENLNEFGYDHYEISNFSYKNKKTIHNLLYWQGDEYIGCGPSSHSHWNGKRYSNISDIDKYIYNLENSKSIINMSEKLSLTDKIKETFTMWLRLTDGVNIRVFEKKFSCKIENIYDSKINELISNGLLERKKDYIKIPDDKIFLSNSIMSELI